MLLANVHALRLRLNLSMRTLTRYSKLGVGVLVVVAAVLRCFNFASFMSVQPVHASLGGQTRVFHPLVLESQMLCSPASATPG